MPGTAVCPLPKRAKHGIISFTCKRKQRMRHFANFCRGCMDPDFRDTITRGRFADTEAGQALRHRSDGRKRSKSRAAAAEGGRADAARRGGRKARAVSRRPGCRPGPILLQSRASSVFVRRAGAAARGVLGGRGQTRAKGSVHIIWKNL